MNNKNNRGTAVMGWVLTMGVYLDETHHYAELTVTREPKRIPCTGSLEYVVSEEERDFLLKSLTMTMTGWDGKTGPLQKYIDMAKEWRKEDNRGYRSLKEGYFDHIRGWEQPLCESLYGPNGPGKSFGEKAVFGKDLKHYILQECLDNTFFFLRPILIDKETGETEIGERSENVEIVVLRSQYGDGNMRRLRT